jgi:hypothetical protein
MGYRNISQGYRTHALLEAKRGVWDLAGAVLEYLVPGLRQSWYKTDRNPSRARSLRYSQNESVLYKGADFLRNSVKVRSEPSGHHRFAISCTRIGGYLIQDIAVSQEAMCDASA